MAEIPLSDLWQKIVTTVKDRVNNRSLWETLEKTVAIAVEGDVLVLGLNARVFNQAGHLTVSEHRNAIEQAASRIAGRPLRIRVIEGDTPEDWAFTKKRDERVAALREVNYERQDREEARAQSWDSLLDQISRAYSSTPLRSLPQNKARFLTEMLYLMSDAMDNLYPDPPDDAAERHLSRVIEKVAGSADVSATLVALELERLRAWRRQSSQ